MIHRFFRLGGLVAMALSMGMAPTQAQGAGQSIRAAIDSSLPDSAGIPTVVLVVARRPGGEVWYGTYGRGIFVRRRGGAPDSALRHLAARGSDSTLISFNFVNSIAFGPRGEVWYGTVGNGWGLSTDSGRTWHNWTLAQLGPEWQYVAPRGIVTHGDTTVIGTADGLQVTTDDGTHWVAFGDTVGPAANGPADTAVEILPSEYVLGVRREASGWTVTHLHGSVLLDLAGCLRRAHGVSGSRCVRRSQVNPYHAEPVGLSPQQRAVARSAKGWMPWFARPIAAGDNDHIDQTYRWGSTMGGEFQQHQGVEFNNPDGTRVHAIGNGTVVYADRAEGGALTVGIRHDTTITIHGTPRYIFSAYYHNSALLVHVGQHVTRGEVVSRVGNTGRATNDHMHLEVSVAPTDSVPPIIDSLNRYPPYATNPELWITPLPGTGLIAGLVMDSTGARIPQARVYGIGKPLPRETPYVYAETYGEHNPPSPMYGENFAISDVPAGTHHLFVVINGKRIRRTVVVHAGAMTWVEFRP